MIASDCFVDAKLCHLCSWEAKKQFVLFLLFVCGTCKKYCYKERVWGVFEGVLEIAHRNEKITAAINDADMLSHDAFGLAGTRRKHLFSPYGRLSPSLSPQKTSITARQRTERKKKKERKKNPFKTRRNQKITTLFIPLRSLFWNTMQSDAWKISGTTVGWTAGGNFGDIIRVLASFCSFVICSSKAVIALVSSYLPDDEHSRWTMLTRSHAASWCHLLEEK